VRSPLFTGNPDPLPIEIAPAQPFERLTKRFINVSAFDPRKNIPGLLRAWLRATSRDDDAALLIKLSCHLPGSRRLVDFQLDMAQAAVGKSLEDAAPVRLRFDVLSNGDMARLYAAGTHYVSMSHGEGWDLPMMEAVASGLIPVAPDHSAYPAYLDPSVAHVIPSVVAPAIFPGGGVIGALFTGLDWWNPDEETAVEILRGIIRRNEYPSASARDRVLGEYTWERAAKRLIAILEEAAVSSPA
jgi:glycosyltransferase involved in cell wall biosynthesis